MTVLLLADIDGRKLSDATAKTLSAARDIGGPIHVLVAGHEVSEAAQAAALLEGVDKVLVADSPLYAKQLAEPLALLVADLAKGCAAFVASASSTAKNVAPRVAALLDVMQVSEITKVLAPDTFERPIYAGNALQTVRSRDPIKVVTVRTAAFPAAEQGATAAAIEHVSPGSDPQLSAFKEESVARPDRPELGSARVVVSGGRAMQSAENFTKYIAPVADRLNAAIGASRAAVDAGYAPNDWQVGQTGKVVAPDLYVAAGISGAIQHLAGMKDSKVIVAINKDEEAPIFQVADYGLVADLFTALPELAEELGKSRQ
jgi:electron transfer flavoprotein alpha subunit